MHEAVLRIYYTQNGKLKAEPQGKFYYLNGKPTFLADMTPSKWWKNFGGYSIAKQLLQAFSKAHLRLQIIYRRKDLKTLYFATPNVFKTKGILLGFGGHSQFCLPIKNFTCKAGDVSYEPKDLPVMDLNDWQKSAETARRPISLELFAANKLSGGYFI